MNGQVAITLIGNLTNDPELRFTPTGDAVANFTVASTPRTLDKRSNEWKDGETLFLRCTIWREAAENAAESLARGSRVIASGRLRSRTYQAKDGENRTVVELEVDEIGPSLRYATAKVTKVDRVRGGLPSATPATEADPWSAAQGSVQNRLGGREIPAGDAPF